jgi:N-methylhydantoinase A
MDERYIIYIDTGGTFSDSVIVKPDGNYVRGKSPTTPGRLQECFFKCIEAAAEKMGLSLKEVLSKTAVVGYGTTEGTNIVVSGIGGPKLGFITTKGSEDRTLIMRLRAAGLNRVESFHQATADKPKPLIPKRLIRGVTERVDSFGEVVIPLIEEEARSAVKELLEEGVEGIAVGFLWSVINPIHERRVKEIIKEIAPDIPVSISSDVAPVIREYPRYMSTIIDLYIGKALRELLEDIKEGLSANGYNNPLLVMQAAGGLARAEVVKPVTTLHSGPVGGLTGVDFLKKLYGYKNAMGSDVGGTSFDITISPETGVEMLREPIVGRFEICNPMCEIITIGAGGGTVAYVDKATKLLMVGPKSAGASPGPVCYGLGGTEPTVTDADVVMNRIDPDYFLGGKIKLDRESAVKAIKEKIAEPLGMDVMDAAEGICKIIDGNMQAILKTTVATKGIDPHNFIMFAFGGAGGAHCAGYTSNLGFPKVIIPPYAATFSAFGAATADILHRYEASPFILIPNIPYDPVTLRYKLDELKSLDNIPSWVPERFNNMYEELERRADKDMMDEGFGKENVTKRYEMLARYGGQLWELRCAIPVNKIKDIEDLRKIIKAFEEEYFRMYTKEAMSPRGGIEIVSIIVEARAEKIKPILTKKEFVSKIPPKDSIKGEREVYFDGRWVNTKIYEMDKLNVGNIIEGIAIIEGYDTTIVIPKDRKVTVDEYLNMVMEYR